MRPIHLAHLDKARPVLVLTRDNAPLTTLTVAPITRTVRGISTEVPVDQANGLDASSAVSCDNIGTIPVSSLGRRIGYLLPAQEQSLTEAIHAAFNLADPS
jgi:mRNA interferase MazF